MSSLVGIDLGNSRIKLAIPDGQGNPVMQSNEVGELFTHSVVFFDKDRIIVGSEALNAGLADPKRCVRNWKRKMGTDEVLYRAKDEKEYRAKDIAAILLKHIAEAYEQKTGLVLSEAGISVPANYTDRQKAETIEAAGMAGIAVTLTPHEPTAAIFGNQVHKRGEGTYALLDLGGGTFDVSIVQVSGNNVEVLATGGEPDLGGQDFNDRLEGYALDEFEKEHGFRPDADKQILELQDLAQRIEQIKLTLSVRDSANLSFVCGGKVFSRSVTREAFGGLVEDVIQRAMDRTEETLRETGIQALDLREIIPVGGASQMPTFLEGIEARFGKKPSFHAEPYYAVALGCVTLARLTKEAAGEQISVHGRRLPPLEHRIHEVTAHPIGICCLGESGREVCSVILPKGVPMPSDQTKGFQLAEKGQTGARIEILQAGEGTPLKECQMLGRFELSGLEPTTGKVHRIDIRLRIDKNGMLQAEARDPQSGKSEQMKVKYEKSGVGRKS